MVQYISKTQYHNRSSTFVSLIKVSVSSVFKLIWKLLS